MNKRLLFMIIVIGMVFLAMGAVVRHWLAGSAASFSPRVPIPEPNMGSGEAAPSVFSQISFSAGVGKAAGASGVWPGFRGANRDAIGEFVRPLRSDWQKQPLPVKWSLTLGEGHGGPAVVNGRAYLLDYNRDQKRDVIRCLSLDTGQDIWSVSYPVTVKRNHGMSRTVPAVKEPYVLTLGPKGHVVCLNCQTGEFLWGIDFVRDYQTTIPEWYAGQCPLIDNDYAIIAPAGTALMIACELATGKVVWQTPNPDAAQMTHSSIMPVTVGGQRLYVYCATNGVYGVQADSGAIAFFYPDWTIKIANIPSPLQIAEDKIFLAGGYNAGSMILQLHINAANGSCEVKPVVRFPAARFGSDQQTPIFYKGHIYGVRPDRRLVCMDLEEKILWHSGKDRFGLGPFVIVNDRIIALADDGMLYLIEAEPKEYHRLAAQQVLTGHDAWAPLAAAEPYLLCRDLTTLICLQLAQ